MTEVNAVTDLHFLRLVLERQPAAAPSGQRRMIWHEIANAVNDASGHQVFGSSGSAIQRLRFLESVLENEDHAMHGQLTAEMVDVLQQLRDGMLSAPKRGRLRPRKEPHKAEVQQDDEASAPPKRRKGEKSRAAMTTAPPRERDDVSLEQLFNSTALVPYSGQAHPPHSALEAFGRFLGAQAERDRQARDERERLRRELADCKHEIAMLQGTQRATQCDTDHLTGNRLLTELGKLQQRTFEELKADRDEWRVMLKQALDPRMPSDV